MDKLPTLGEYLQEQKQLLPTIGEKELRRRYRNLYQRHYQKQRKSHHTITLRLEKSLHKHFLQQQKKHSYTSTNAFLLDCIQAYLTKGYVFPNQQETKALTATLQSINNSLSQQRRKLDSFLRQLQKSSAPDLTYTALESFLKVLELQKSHIQLSTQQVTEFLSTPQLSVLGFAWEDIQDNQEGKLDTLITFLLDHKKTLSDASD